MIGIDAYHIILLGRCLQVVAPILHHHVQIGFIHMKVLPCQVYNRAIDLDAINRYRPVGGAKLTWNSSGAQTDDSDFAHLLLCEGRLIEIGSNQKIVPGTLGEYLVWIVDGMNAQAFIQDQLRFTACLHDLDIIIM